MTVAAALGYYLYAGGGDPKVAEKKFERTALAPPLVELRSPLR